MRQQRTGVGLIIMAIGAFIVSSSIAVGLSVTTKAIPIFGCVIGLCLLLVGVLISIGRVEKGRLALSIIGIAVALGLLARMILFIVSGTYHERLPFYFFSTVVITVLVTKHIRILLNAKK